MEAPPVDGLPLVLPAHLTANFEKADRQLLESYGSSPGVAGLVRLWVAPCFMALVNCQTALESYLQKAKSKLRTRLSVKCCKTKKLM